MERSAAVVERLAESGEPAYGVSTGFGSLAQTRIPAERRDRAAARADPLARRRHGPAGRARGGAGDDAAARAHRWRWATRAPARSSPRRSSRCSTPGLTPVVPEHGSLGASGDLAPLAHCALALIGEGEVLDADGRPRAGGRGARATPGSSRSTLGAKEGLALINGTDGILGMLVLALARPRRACCALADVAAAMSVEALLGTDRAFAEDLVALRPQPGQARERRQPAPAARRLGDRRQPPRRTTRGSRTPTRCAARRRCTAPPATPLAHAERGRRGRAGVGDRQPDGPARRPGRVVRQLPRRAARRSPATSSRSPPPRSARSPSAAPTACSTPTRSHGLPPFLAPDAGRRLGADDRPVHAGGDGGREPPAGRPGVRSTRCRPARCRRTTSRWAGAAARKLRASVANLGRILAVELACAARGLDLRAPLEPARRDRRRARGACASVVGRARARPLAGAGAARGRASCSRRRRRCSAAVDGVRSEELE